MARLMVTGGAGFIGAHLVKRLVERGDEVVIIDNLRRASPVSVAGAVETGRATLFESDIRDFDATRRLMSGCNTVFHLAAQSNVMGAMDDPEYSVTTNVLGTFNVFRAAAEAGVSRVVFASSREVYGDVTELPVVEGTALVPKNAYGASKVSGEAYARTFAGKQGLRIEIVRLANVYGPGDSARVIPLWLEAALRGEDLSVFGGEQVIDFVWIGTVVDALIHASANGLPGPVNIASGEPTKILDLADRILRETGSQSRVVRTAAREIEVARFVADTTLMRSLGLVPDADPLSHLSEIASTYRPS